MNFIITVGGTGARIAESFVYYSATGAVNKNERFKIYVVDKDLNCGNTVRLQSTINHYTNMKEATGLPCMYPSFEWSGWNFEPYMKVLDPYADAEYAVYRNVAGTNPIDKTILDMFHSGEEQDKRLRDGFWGCANLGAAIIESIFSTEKFNTDNELFTDIDNAIRANPNAPVNIVLTASIFGGTGASIFPAMGAMLRSKYPQANINGVLMLPYFRYGSNNLNDANGADQAAAIGWKNFMNKAVVALSHYARHEGFVKGMPSSNGSFILNSINLIGSSVLEQSCDTYQPGGRDQKHGFLVPDLYAAEAINSAFADPDPDLAAGFPNIFGFSTGNTGVGPDSFAKPKEVANFAELAFAIRAYLYPYLNKDDIIHDSLLTGPFGSTGLIKKTAKCNVDTLRGLVNQSVPFCDDYIRYVLDIHKDPADLHDVKLVNYVGLDTLYQCVRDVPDSDSGSLAEQIKENIQNAKCSVNPDADMVHIPREFLDKCREANARDKNENEGFKVIVKALYDKLYANVD